MAARVRRTFPGTLPALWIFRPFAVWPLVAGSLTLLLCRMRRFQETARQLRGTSSAPPDSELPAHCFHLGGAAWRAG